MSISLISFAQPLPTEIHDRIARNERPYNRIALTPDGLIELLRRGLVFVRLDQVDLTETKNGTCGRR
jgi:hypothetical protein